MGNSLFLVAFISTLLIPCFARADFDSLINSAQKATAGIKNLKDQGSSITTQSKNTTAPGAVDRAVASSGGISDEDPRLTQRFAEEHPKALADHKSNCKTDIHVSISKTIKMADWAAVGSERLPNPLAYCSEAVDMITGICGGFGEETVRIKPQVAKISVLHCRFKNEKLVPQDPNEQSDWEKRTCPRYQGDPHLQVSLSADGKTLDFAINYCTTNIPTEVPDYLEKTLKNR